MKQIKERLLVLGLSLVLCGTNMYSQESLQDFWFLYVDHEPGMGTHLLDKIKEVHKEALQNGRELIVYLASNRSPILYRANHENATEDDEEFNKLFMAINESVSHTVKPDVDRKQLLQMFAEILYGKEQDKFDRLKITFLVGEEFMKGYHTDFFAHICAILKQDQNGHGIIISIPRYNEQQKIDFGTYNLIDNFESVVEVAW